MLLAGARGKLFISTEIKMFSLNTNGPERTHVAHRRQVHWYAIVVEGCYSQTVRIVLLVLDLWDGVRFIIEQQLNSYRVVSSPP